MRNDDQTTDEPAEDPFAPVFASDLASEIRNEFLDTVEHGLPVADATATILERFGALLSDPDDGPVVIIAVATLQYMRRELYASFRDAAVDLIDSGAAMRAYTTHEYSASTDRRTLLRNLRSLLVDSEVLT